MISAKIFSKQLKDFLSIEINPSPQPERLLKLTEISNSDFKGILKRHQNLLFISKPIPFRLIGSKTLSLRDKKFYTLNARQ